MLTKNRMNKTENKDRARCNLTHSTKNESFIPGTMTEGCFWLLVEISSIHSEKVITALHDHLVLGYARRDVCEKYRVSAGYLSLSITRLLRIEAVAASLSTYYK